MPALRIRLLGGLEITNRGGVPLSLVRKYKLVLACMALCGAEGISRERLFDLFWGDYGEEQARTNLRQALTAVRRALGNEAGVLISDGGQLRLDRAAVTIDVDIFETCAARGTQAGCQEAMAIYDGDLLDGVTIKEPIFENWLQPKRERCRGVYLGAGAELLRRFLRVENSKEAIETAKRVLQVDPLHEEAHRGMIASLERLGQRNAALQHFEKCREAIESTLGVPPEPKTLKLVGEIRRQAAGQASPRTDRSKALFDADLPQSTKLGIDISLPEVPAIAVLPLKNQSEDPAHDFFPEALTDGLTAALTKISKLFIVASASTRGYASGPHDVRRIGREQGVHFVLDGSVQRTDTHVRVVVQLIDCQNARSHWADHFECSLDDLFAVQDRIIQEIVVALQVELTEGEQARMWASSTQSVAAWDLVMQATDLLNRHIKEDTVKAAALLERSLAIDAGYATAWCKLAWCHWSEARHDWSLSPDQSLDKAVALAQRAAQLDPDAAEPHTLIAMSALQAQAFDQVIPHAQKALSRASGDAFVFAICAMAISHCGMPVEAARYVRHAMRLSPIFPDWYRMVLGRALFLSRDLTGTIAVLEPPGVIDGSFHFPAVLIAAYWELGQRDAARGIASEALKAEPDFNIKHWIQPQRYRNPEDLERVVSVLKALELPP